MFVPYFVIVYFCLFQSSPVSGDQLLPRTAELQIFTPNEVGNCLTPRTSDWDRARAILATGFTCGNSTPNRYRNATEGKLSNGCVIANGRALSPFVPNRSESTRSDGVKLTWKRFYRRIRDIYKIA